VASLAIAVVDGDDIEYDGDVECTYDWGSLTKTLTARLHEELVQDLDAPISTWVDAPSSITLRSLATHTSGLPRMPSNFSPADEADPWADYTVDRLLAWTSNVELGAPARLYSNVGYCLLGHVLSIIGGAPIEALIESRVLRAAGIERSGYGLPVVAGHDDDRRPVPTWTIAPGMGGVGGVHGPIDDLVRWLLVSRSRASELGWHVDGDYTLHDGGTYGSSAFAAWHRHDGRGVAVLAAQHGMAVQRGIEVLRASAHA